MNNPKEISAALLESSRLIALAGQPASGKSTLSNILADLMTSAGCRTSVVPMDGFHLDNQILISKGLLPRKGAPEAFDVDGLLRLMKALRSTDTVFFPVFDRERDIAVAGAGMLSDDCDSVIVEGNYLLLDAPRWRDLKDCWDLSVQLSVSTPVLMERLVNRWLAHGLAPAEALARSEGNDLRNAELIAAHSLSADVIITA